MADIARLAALLHETSEHYGEFEKVATDHDWWDWYAAYLEARRHGRSPAEASTVAADHMAGLGVGFRP